LKEDPIKTEFEGRRIFLLKDKKPLYVFKVGINYAILKDSMFGRLSSAVKRLFVSLEMTEAGMAENVIYPEFLIMMNFYLNSKITTTDREIFSLFDAVAVLGGMISLIVGFIEFLVSDVQRFLYQAHIAKESFMTINFKEDNGIEGENYSPSKIRN
jgi:hypothetical protein